MTKIVLLKLHSGEHVPIAVLYLNVPKSPTFMLDVKRAINKKLSQLAKKGVILAYDSWDYGE